MYDVEKIPRGWVGNGETFEVLSPFDARPVTRVPVAGPDQVAAAVKTARGAQPGWAATPAAHRGAALHAIADAVEADAAHLAQAIHDEVGKPLDDAAGGVAAGVATLRQYAELGPLHRGRSLLGGIEALDVMAYRPRGVVAVLTPWNDPVAVSCGLLGAALVTGNTVVYKPSERASAAGWLLARAFADHVPDGVLNLVTGDGAVGATLAEAAVDVVAHVGSTAIGRSIAAACARTGAKALLENGGSDPLIVDADVDPGWAADQAALGAFANSGQICVAVERIYVHRAVSDAFVDALADRAGDWADRIGPLVDVRHRAHVHGHVVAGLQAGARVVTGGEIPPGPGAYYPPTVLVDCTDDMAVLADETFGPVAPVVVVEGWDEALQRAGRSPYGLAATVLTGSMSHAQAAWRELEVGTVKVNAVFGGAPGGAAHPRRGSGHGHGYGPELLDEVTVTSVLHLQAPPTGW
jgi:succinate-semialdehyde dehydrogenase/glutarate-semialdehyde dehydrogenase